MNFELTGKLVEKFDEVKVSETFRKREFVVETNDGKFSETIKFQLIQDKCALIDNVNINEDINVSFNIRGRRWEKDGNVSYFTNLDAWKIEKKQNGPSDEAPPPFEDSDVPYIPSEDDDDLPF